MALATTGRLGAHLSRLGRIRLGWPDAGAARAPGEDAGLGLDVAGLEIAVADSATGADVSLLEFRVVDAGAATDTAEQPAIVPGEIGTGTDTARVEIQAADAGAGADGAYWEILVGDSGSGTDAVSALDRTAADAGAGFDGVPATYELTDAGSGADASHLIVQGSDGGFGSDGDPSFNVFDVGLGFDRRVKQILSLDPELDDSGTGTDTATVNNFDDYGVGTDTATVEVRIGQPAPGEPGYIPNPGPGQPGGPGHPLSDRGTGSDRARLLRSVGPGGGPGDGEVRVSQLVVEFPLEATLPITFEPPPWWYWYPWIPPEDVDESPPGTGTGGGPEGPPSQPPIGRPGYGALGNQTRASQVAVEVVTGTEGGSPQAPQGTLIGL